jgi:hypothetical protein
VGGLGVLAYAAHEFSGHSDYTGAASNTIAGAFNLGINAAGFAGATAANAALLAATTKYNGHYDSLKFGSGGVALTHAGFTLGANAIGGDRGQLLRPDHQHLDQRRGTIPAAVVLPADAAKFGPCCIRLIGCARCRRGFIASPVASSSIRCGRWTAR